MCAMATTLRMLAACACALLCWTAQCALEATLCPGGAVDFGGRRLEPFAFLPGWRGAAKAGGYSVGRDGTVSMRLVRGRQTLFDATVSLSPHGEGGVRIDYVFTAAACVEVESIGCTMLLPAKEASGQAWRTENASGTFDHRADGAIQLGSGECRAFGFSPAAGAPPLRFAAVEGPAPRFRYLVQDDYRWRPDYTVRFGALGRRTFAKGETFRLSLVATAGAPLAVRLAEPYVVRPGKDWTPIDYRRDIEPFSALDFSHMGFADAPAGRHGWLRNVGGHFEFERLPGRPQRFYGLNLCGTANFPDHALADTLVARFRRLGYNALRMHHHDNGMVGHKTDGVALDPDAMDRFDYFVAAAIRQGLYITTDAYVSRKVAWRSIGIDKEGVVDIQLFKALCAVYEPAFENWAAFARNFFSHVNPYTGRRYADEPAMPLVSLVNEGGFFMGWERGVRDDPRVLASWRDWLAARRAKDPGFAPDLSPDALPENFWAGGIHPAVAAWTGELEARLAGKASAFLRSIGVKAMLTNGNCGPHYAALQRATAAYDYIDDHFYVDHPSFPEKDWALPSKCPNANPLLGTGRLSPSAQAFTRMAGKPFTVTEWNFAGPGRYRGVGGILAGAMAALQGWDGLWRFAYSHSRDGLGDASVRSPGYFDVASDPLAQAGERACLCLFMRGDLAPFDGGVALWVAPECADGRTGAWKGAPPWCDAAWQMLALSCLSPKDADGLRVLRRDEADSADISPDARPCALSLDRERGSFTIDTPRTCGGFVPDGEFSAGALRAKVSGAPATVWVHSLSGDAIRSAPRLLLSHVTDVQGDGATFADETMTTTLKWGSRPLARNGVAQVALRLDNPERYTVHALATSGKRLATVPSRVRGGWLVFTADVAGPEGARMLYEIVR